MTPEQAHEKALKDCDIILKEMADLWKPQSMTDAEKLITQLFIPDMAFSREGISMAMSQLRRDLQL